jgi:hypothetical protein
MDRSTRRQRRRRGALVLTVLATVTGLVVAAAPVSAWTRGVNRVKSAAKNSSVGTGYGRGAVGLSYKSNGPIVGYLFAGGFRFADGSIKGGSDRVDIRGTRDYKGGHPRITRWPWGFAYGSFGGCAYAYGTFKFAKVRERHSTRRCANGPRGGPHHNWWHSERIFCTAHRTDPLCSPAGVWSTGKLKGHRGTRKARSRGCTVYGNVGAAAVYGAGAPAPRHPLGTVPANQRISVRYVTKNRAYAMARWRGHRLQGGLVWAFFPRGCLIP